jgi:elongation factor Ts
VAEISAQAVKTLREQTGAGMMDCKRALADAGGDLQKAGALLRERGLAKAVKRAGRATSEGTIGMALAGASGALMELGCETDFVAKTDDFVALAGRLAEAAARDAGAASVEALLDAEVDGSKGRELVSAAIAKLGENIVPKRVARLAVAGGGHVGGYVHAGGKLGVLVGLRTKARGDAVAALAKDLAMHVAAADPTPVAVERGGVPAELVETERALYRKQAEASGKPAQVLDRIVEGRLGKFYSEICLLEQAFVKDPDRRVKEVVEALGKQLGQPLEVTAFVRFRVGEDAGEEGPES